MWTEVCESSVPLKSWLLDLGSSAWLSPLYRLLISATADAGAEPPSSFSGLPVNRVTLVSKSSNERAKSKGMTDCLRES